MGTTKSQSWKTLYWALAFLMSGLLYVPMAAMAQTTEATEPSDDDDEETPVCPGRPLAVHPTEEDVKNTGLSFEVLCVIADTYLFRHDMPGPDESPDLLRRYLQEAPYENLSKEQYVAVMEEAVRLWPKSRYAHAGLAYALLEGGHGIQDDPAVRRRAADEFLIAAEIVFSKGGVLYVMDLAPLLADLGDKAALDRYFQRVFELLPKGKGRYMSYFYYAQALAKLGDERAETYFQKAVAGSPEGVVDAYGSYARYLLDHHKAQAVLELLTPNSQVERAMYKPSFHQLRCQALEQLGQKAEAAAECQQARDLTPSLEMPNPVGRPGNGPSSRGPRAPAEPGFLARLLGVGLAYADYENTNDDCRLDQTQSPPKCTVHPDDPNWVCFYDYVWNLAELITREAGGELFGAQAAVGWTVRDRVNRESTPECGVFPGVNQGCTLECPNPDFCDLQKKYCCVIRAPGQFAFQSVSVSIDTLNLAANVVLGSIPEPTSDFVPTGTSCTTGVCNSSLQCSPPGGEYEYAPEGPNYFYANCKVVNGVTECDPACKGFQPLVNANCNVVAKETCGNSTDGVGSDNCYGRATRNRKWLAGPDFFGSTRVTTTANAKRLPVGTYIYRNDQFKNPGGKQIHVQARLETAGQTNLRVLLKNSVYDVIYDFGTLSVTSTTFADLKFTSTIVVTPPVSQVVIINEGPGVGRVQAVKAKD